MTSHLKIDVKNLNMDAAIIKDFQNESLKHQLDKDFAYRYINALSEHDKQVLLVFLSLANKRIKHQYIGVAIFMAINIILVASLFYVSLNFEMLMGVKEGKAVVQALITALNIFVFYRMIKFTVTLQYLKSFNRVATKFLIDKLSHLAVD